MGFEPTWKRVVAPIALVFSLIASSVEMKEETPVKDYTDYLNQKGCDTKNLRPGEIPFCPDEPKN